MKMNQPKMNEPKLNGPPKVIPNKFTVAQQVASAARHFHQQRTGHAPTTVTVVLSADTLVVTLHNALSPAEKAMARNPAGAAQVQEFHRQLFHSSCEELRQEIKRITGIAVREAAAEIQPATATIVHAFTNGDMVQVFQLAEGMSQETWHSIPAEQHDDQADALLAIP